MRVRLSKSMAAVVTGTFMTQLALAHPGHAPTDVAAEISQPLAGPDHFIAFIALTSVLLGAARFVFKMRHAKTGKA